MIALVLSNVSPVNVIGLVIYSSKMFLLIIFTSNIFYVIFFLSQRVGIGIVHFYVHGVGWVG